MTIFRLSTSFVDCQYFSSSVPWTGRGSSPKFVIAVVAAWGSSPKFAIAFVAVSAPVPRIHIVNARSHEDASGVRFTTFAPTILGLTFVHGIGKGVALGYFVPSEETKARRAIGNFELDFRTPSRT